MVVGLLLSLMSCNDTEVGVYNTPPSVTITAPEDGVEVAPGEALELAGIARDDQQEAPSLLVSWSSSVDGPLGSSTPDASGIVLFPVTGLTAGRHVVTLEAIDDSGDAGRATLEVDIGYGGDVVGAPRITLIGPVEGEVFPASEGVNVVAAVEDDEQPPETLLCEIVSSRDGLLWSGSPATNGGLTQLVSGLSPGIASLTLRCEDDDAKVGSEMVEVEVLEDARPWVTINDPVDGSMHWTTDTVVFDAQLSDDLTDAEVLELSLTSDVAGAVWSGNADSSGKATGSFSLAEGTHTLTLTAVDEDGNDGSDSVQIFVTDPLNYDNDGDGYTENGGDCDDGDPKVSPGEAEVCDTVDQDCDGYVNEDWWDTYEQNESQSAAYDFGTVDGVFFADDTLEVSGLTLSDPNDEDWYVFDADEDILENIYFDVTVSGLPSGGGWVVELYDLNNGGVLYTSGSTTGTSVMISKPVDWWEFGEDDWAIRVYSTSWKAAGCTTTYTLTIDTYDDGPPI